MPRFAVRNHRLPGFTVCMLEGTDWEAYQVSWLMHKDDTQALSRSKEARPFSMVAESLVKGTRGIRGSEEKRLFGLDFLSHSNHWVFRLLWTDSCSGEKGVFESEIVFEPESYTCFATLECLRVICLHRSLNHGWGKPNRRDASWWCRVGEKDAEEDPHRRSKEG